MGYAYIRGPHKGARLPACGRVRTEGTRPHTPSSSSCGVGVPPGAGTVTVLAAGDAETTPWGILGLPSLLPPPAEGFVCPAGACPVPRCSPGQPHVPGTNHGVAAICSSRSGLGSLEK